MLLIHSVNSNRDEKRRGFDRNILILALLFSVSQLYILISAMGQSNTKATTKPEVNTDLDKIILIGDSITEQGYQIGGWVGYLSNKFIRKFDVINRGYGGNVLTF